MIKRVIEKIKEYKLEIIYIFCMGIIVIILCMLNLIKMNILLRSIIILIMIILGRNILFIVELGLKKIKLKRRTAKRLLNISNIYMYIGYDKLYLKIGVAKRMFMWSRAISYYCKNYICVIVRIKKLIFIIVVNPINRLLYIYYNIIKKWKIKSVKELIFNRVESIIIITVMYLILDRSSYIYIVIILGVIYIYCLPQIKWILKKIFKKEIIKEEQVYPKINDLDTKRYEISIIYKFCSPYSSGGGNVAEYRFENYIKEGLYDWLFYPYDIISIQDVYLDIKPVVNAENEWYLEMKNKPSYGWIVFLLRKLDDLSNSHLELYCGILYKEKITEEDYERIMKIKQKWWVIKKELLLYIWDIEYLIGLEKTTMRIFMREGYSYCTIEMDLREEFVKALVEYNQSSKEIKEGNLIEKFGRIIDYMNYNNLKAEAFVDDRNFLDDICDEKVKISVVFDEELLVYTMEEILKDFEMWREEWENEKEERIKKF